MTFWRMYGVFKMYEDTRRGKGVRGEEEIIVGGWNRRGDNEDFLKTHDLGLIARKEVAEIISMGSETSEVPL